MTYAMDLIRHYYFDALGLASIITCCKQMKRHVNKKKGMKKEGKEREKKQMKVSVIDSFCMQAVTCKLQSTTLQVLRKF